MFNFQEPELNAPKVRLSSASTFAIWEESSVSEIFEHTSEQFILILPVLSLFIIYLTFGRLKFLVYLKAEVSHYIISN